MRDGIAPALAQLTAGLSLIAPDDRDLTDLAAQRLYHLAQELAATRAAQAVARMRACTASR